MPREPKVESNWRWDVNHKCPECTFLCPLPDFDGKFCTNCGTKQSFPEAESVKCSACKKEVDRDWNFCMSCGTKLEKTRGGT